FKLLPHIGHGFMHTVIDLLIKFGADIATRSVPQVSSNEDNYTNRLSNIKQWNQFSHPVVIFYKNPNDENEVNGIDILSLDSKIVDKTIDESLRYALSINGLSLNQQNITYSKAKKILQNVAGIYSTSLMHQ